MPIENRAKLLMRQATTTAGEYLRQAIERIDSELGAGFAKEHPELIGAFMKTAALDFAATFNADSTAELRGAIGDVARRLRELATMIEERPADEGLNEVISWPWRQGAKPKPEVREVER